MPLERDPAGRLAVHSMFNTIQGEGPHAGRAALFIRLVGCNLQCPGCDTEYTQHRTLFTPEELAHTASMMTDFSLVVITGGEPFRQNITPAVYRLLAHFDVQIESNGVLYPGDDFPWRSVEVVVSPKTGKIHPKTAQLARAFKYVVKAGDVSEKDGLPIHALNHSLGNYPHVARPPLGWVGPVYLQPMDEQDEELNKQNGREVARIVMAHPYRNYVMGVQMHKMTGLP